MLNFTQPRGPSKEPWAPHPVSWEGTDYTKHPPHGWDEIPLFALDEARSRPCTFPSLPTNGQLSCFVSTDAENKVLLAYEPTLG